MLRSPSRAALRRLISLVALRPLRASAALVVLAACGGRGAPPSPDAAQARPPEMAGRRVMVLPAQLAPGHVPEVTVPGAPRQAVEGFDSALAEVLGRTAPGVEWVLPPEVERAAARNPALGISPGNLEVSSFHRATVENIGDPLFGDLRMLAAILDARWALVPVAAAYMEDEAGGGRVEVAAALIDTSTGRVPWFGVVAGEPGPRGREAAASAAVALARQFGR